jgi:hypothetical protein
VVGWLAAACRRRLAGGYALRCCRNRLMRIAGRMRRRADYLLSDACLGKKIITKRNNDRHTNTNHSHLQRKAMYLLQIDKMLSGNQKPLHSIAKSTIM